MVEFLGAAGCQASISATSGQAHQKPPALSILVKRFFGAPRARRFHNPGLGQLAEPSPSAPAFHSLRNESMRMIADSISNSGLWKRSLKDGKGS